MRFFYPRQFLAEDRGPELRQSITYLSGRFSSRGFVGAIEPSRPKDSKSRQPLLGDVGENVELEFFGQHTADVVGFETHFFEQVERREIIVSNLSFHQVDGLLLHVA